MKIFRKIATAPGRRDSADEIAPPVRTRFNSGPGGRFSSRGWNRDVELDERGHGIYELTPFGRAWLEKRMPSANSSMGEHQEQIGREFSAGFRLTASRRALMMSIIAFGEHD